MYLQINYKVVARRDGDVAAMCADPKKAEVELGWKATYSLDDMCKFTANAWLFCSAFQDILNRVYFRGAVSIIANFKCLVCSKLLLNYLRMDICLTKILISAARWHTEIHMKQQV